MTDQQPTTTDSAYTARLAASTAPRTGWRRLIDPQVPYRWNIRRLGLGRVLDIGCGTGRNLAHLDGNGVGIDHNEASVAEARRRGLTAYTTDEFASSPDATPGSYDSLLFAHVLEHLTLDDAEALVAEYLPRRRVGGKVVVICPQERGFASDATHVTMLTRDDIAALLGRLGLQTIAARSFPFPAAAGRWFTHNETVVVAN